MFRCGKLAPVSVRNYLNLRQEELAKDLSLTFATVNRWENGISFPNKLAQTKLYDYCTEKEVPVYRMVMDKIKNYTRKTKLSKNQQIGQDGRCRLFSCNCLFWSGF